jgi:hypothetical protein
MAKSYSSSPSRLPVIFAILLLGITLVLGFLLYISKQENKALETSLASQSMIPLPENAVKISACLPHMGEHWVEPDALPYGPFYVVHNGEVIGLEYKAEPDKIPGADNVNLSPEEFAKYMQNNQWTFADYLNEFSAHGFDLPNGNVKNLSVAWSRPHPGFITPHYDFHLYYIDKEELQNVCPDALPEDSLSPEILNNLRDNNLPIPGE